MEYIGSRGVQIIIDAGRTSFVDLINQQAVSPIITAETLLKPALPITSWAVTAEEAVNAINFIGAEDSNTVTIDIGVGMPP